MTWLALLRTRAGRWGVLIVAGLLFILTFGASKKRQGKAEAYDEFEEQDRAEADAIRSRVRDVERVQPDDLRFRD